MYKTSHVQTFVGTGKDRERERERKLTVVFVVIIGSVIFELFSFTQHHHYDGPLQSDKACYVLSLTRLVVSDKRLDREREKVSEAFVANERAKNKRCKAKRSILLASLPVHSHSLSLARSRRVKQLIGQEMIGQVWSF